MNVRVCYTTQLKAALRVGSQQVDVQPPGTLAQLLRQLATTHGATFRELVLDEQDRPLSSILLCVGDQQVDADRPLQDGDEVTILSAISGG